MVRKALLQELVVNKKISVFIPMKNESSTISLLFNRVLPVLEKTLLDYEIIVVNDGSTDNTLDLLIEYQKTINNLVIIDLSRNFGKEAALYAGFANALGNCVIAIDADLQDPPELILQMIRYWQEGYEIVTAVREERIHDSFIKKSTANLFYKLINRISDTRFEPNAGDYRLLDRVAVDAFLSLDERVRFNKGLFSWLGFREKFVYHSREPRSAGTTKWSYWKLIRFSLDGITSFSVFPLKIWTFIGLLTSLSAFVYAIYYFIRTMIFGIDVHGYPSLLLFMLFFSGLQMIGIGVLGEYIGRLFIETKRRPLYLIRNIYRNINKSS
ncbi:MAG: glycosyltransferase [Burkholderiales bacterium]|jgi:glycosyltransferase involved in cell wall biosynthesis|nr:glycosyltransferase [Burkholderiales bacterium]MCE3268688.1 glycosyltransferase [Burkholderiales bacterium]